MFSWRASWTCPGKHLGHLAHRRQGPWVTNAAQQDHYATLGVSPNSTPDEIKRAFRRLARQWHPDVNKAAGAEQRFRMCVAAYDVLNDSQSKRTYDAARGQSVGQAYSQRHRSQSGEAGPEAYTHVYQGYRHGTSSSQPTGEWRSTYSSSNSSSSGQRQSSSDSQQRTRQKRQANEAAFWEWYEQAGKASAKSKGGISWHEFWHWANDPSRSPSSGSDGDMGDGLGGRQTRPCDSAAGGRSSQASTQRMRRTANGSIIIEEVNVNSQDDTTNTMSQMDDVLQAFFADGQDLSTFERRMKQLFDDADDDVDVDGDMDGVTAADIIADAFGKDKDPDYGSDDDSWDEFIDMTDLFTGSRFWSMGPGTRAQPGRARESKFTDSQDNTRHRPAAGGSRQRQRQQQRGAGSSTTTVDRGGVWGADVMFAGSRRRQTAPAPAASSTTNWMTGAAPAPLKPDRPAATRAANGSSGLGSSSSSGRSRSIDLGNCSSSSQRSTVSSSSTGSRSKLRSAGTAASLENSQPDSTVRSTRTRSSSSATASRNSSSGSSSSNTSSGTHAARPWSKASAAASVETSSTQSSTAVSSGLGSSSPPGQNSSGHVSSTVPSASATARPAAAVAAAAVKRASAGQGAAGTSHAQPGAAAAVRNVVNAPVCNAAAAAAMATPLTGLRAKRPWQRHA